MRRLYCGDCLEVLEKRIEPNSVDLIYLDPPFFSNRHYEVIWNDEAEVRSFEDRWEGGVKVYAAWMEERLRACHRVLKPTGAIFLHCDWHASHHLRVKLDDIFGYDKFQNEIVWCYSVGGKSKKTFARKHDVIFFYTKSSRGNHTFNAAGASIPRKPNSHMKVGRTQDGRQFQEKTDRKTGKVYRYYLDEGKIAEDYWTDIETLNREDREREGYPTQKPEALLERIVKTSSNEGDLILDPFCGCGTTVIVAERLKRNWIGVDISPTAINLIRRRLSRAGAKSIEMIGLPTTVEELRNLKPFEFQNWVIREKFNGAVGPKGGDKGIDGLTWMLHEPIQVKQSDHIGRNVVDNFHAAMRRMKKKRGYIVAFSFGKGAYEEAAALKSQKDNGVEVVLLTVEELLSKGAI